MKYFSILLYDFRYNFLRKPGKWIAVVAYAVFLFFSFCLSVYHGFYGEVKSPWDVISISNSAGDLFLSELGGELPPYYDNLQSYSFPTVWFVFHILICYFTLPYMREDLSQGGIQVITRTNRKLWWVSKCVLNISVVAAYYFICYTSLLILALCSGRNLTWELNGRIFSFYFAQSLPESHSGNLFMSICVLPCLVGITINLGQMFLTLYVKPIFAFISACIYYIVGIFYAHPLVISNYAIPVRSAEIGLYNFQPVFGIVLCLLSSLAFIVIGAMKIQKQDILGLTA